MKVCCDIFKFPEPTEKFKIQTFYHSCNGRILDVMNINDILCVVYTNDTTADQEYKSEVLMVEINEEYNDIRYSRYLLSMHHIRTNKIYHFFTNQV